MADAALLTVEVPAEAIAPLRFAVREEMERLRSVMATGNPDTDLYEAVESKFNALRVINDQLPGN